MLPPAAQPDFAVRNKISRIGQGPSRVRPVQVLPPSVVACTQPSTLGLISPPPTQPSVSFKKKTGPSKIESTEGPQLHFSPLSPLLQKLIPEARAWRLASSLNCNPNHPPSVLSTTLVQLLAAAPPSVVYWARLPEESPIKSMIKPSLGLGKRTRCAQPEVGRTMSSLQVVP